MSYAGNTERLAILLVTCRWYFNDRPLLSTYPRGRIDNLPKGIQSKSL